MRRNSKNTPLTWLEGPYTMVRKHGKDEVSDVEERKIELELVELVGRQAALADEGPDANPYTAAKNEGNQTAREKHNAWLAGWRIGKGELIRINDR
jgi:ribosome modulation factor